MKMNDEVKSVLGTIAGIGFIAIIISAITLLVMFTIKIACGLMGF